MKLNIPKVKKILIFLVVVVLLVTLLFQCSVSQNNHYNQHHNIEDASANPSRIIICAYTTNNKNPLLAKTSYNEQMNFLMYDGLYIITPNYEAEENLACGYEIQDNGYSALIQLKPNISFHDGSAFTAHDVKATIDYLLNNPGYYSHNIRNIRSATVVDNYTIRLELSELTPNLKLQLTFPIVCKKELLNTSRFQYNGTGPYRMTSETKGKQLVLQQNLDYHRDFKTDIQEIEVSFIPDVETARALSGSGIMDIFYFSFCDEGVKTVTKYESQKFDFLTDEYTFLAFNYNAPLMQEKTFRKALSQAISRDSIRDEVFMTHAESTYLPLPPGSWAYNENKENGRDIEEAKALLQELGFSDTDNNGIIERYMEEEKEELVLNLLSTDDSIKKEICETLIANFKEIGISLNVQYVPLEEFSALYEEKVHDLYLITTNLGYDLDISAFFDGVFDTPLTIDYDNYLKKFAITDQMTIKQPDYMRLCDDFYEYTPHIPLVFLKQTMLTGSKIDAVTAVNPCYFYYEILNQETGGL